jgi:hypothetical protein
MESGRSPVVRFPVERMQRSARTTATACEVAASRLRQWLGRTLSRYGVPGAIQPMEFEDSLAGQHISVSVGEFFVCLSVNGRDYYFDRITGCFDGTGWRPR